MRIFYAVAGTANPRALADSAVWRNNLFLPLVGLGADVVEFDYDVTPYYANQNPLVPEQKEYIEKNRPKLEEELLRQIKNAHRKKPVDVFFSYFSSSIATAETIKEIRGMGITAVNWFCNASFQFERVKDIAAAYDWCLVPEKFRLEDYRKAGARPIYMQEAANPEIYKPYPLKREFDATFVGQRYGNREEFLLHLHKSGVDVRAWGPLWIPRRYKLPFAGRVKKALKEGNFWRAVKATSRRKMANAGMAEPKELPISARGPALSDTEMVMMYSRSKISLGFSSCGETHCSDNPIFQVRLRDFEAPMSGAFYMVERFDELADFFEPDKDIVFFRTKDELVEKVKFYLAHESEREKIREAGRKRALAEHTWQIRLSKAFSEMGFSFKNEGVR